METFKIILIIISILQTANYEEEAGEIIYIINISDEGWKEVLI